MEENNSISTDSRAQDAIYELIAQLLEEGVSPSEISFHLTAHALNLGIQLAPSACHALSIVSAALLQVSKSHSGKTPEKGEGSSKSQETFQEKKSSIVIPFESKPRTVH